MKYPWSCAGVGGTRAGLDAAGWQSFVAVDNDPDAVAVNRLTHGPALEEDVARWADSVCRKRMLWLLFSSLSSPAVRPEVALGFATNQETCLST